MSNKRVWEDIANTTSKTPIKELDRIWEQIIKEEGGYSREASMVKLTTLYQIKEIQRQNNINRWLMIATWVLALATIPLAIATWIIKK